MLPWEADKLCWCYNKYALITYSCLQRIYNFICFREVLVGEHTLSTNPDCRRRGDFCAPEPQKLQIEKVVTHPKWIRDEFYRGYDIALVRVEGNMKLFVSIRNNQNALNLT